MHRAVRSPSMVLGLFVVTLLVASSCRPAPPPGTSHSPSGSLDSAVVVGYDPGSNVATVRVRGWASDWDTREPIQVVLARTSATGSGSTVTWLGGTVADVPRPDVDAAFGRGAGFGFDIEVPIVVQEQTVCVGALNVGPGTDTLIGCAPAAGPTGG